MSIGERLVRLVRDAGVYRDVTTTGHSRLSTASGLLVSAIASTCKLSLNQFPMMVTDLLFMLFGSLTVAEIKDLVCCSNTYENAALAVSDLVSDDVKARFTTEREKDTGTVVASIQFDASNKGNADLMMFLLSALRQDGKIVMTGVRHEVMETKKAEPGAETMIEQLTAELSIEVWHLYAFSTLLPS
jgi:hypothetical protein